MGGAVGASAKLLAEVAFNWVGGYRAGGHGLVVAEARSDRLRGRSRGETAATSTTSPR